MKGSERDKISSFVEVPGFESSSLSKYISSVNGSHPKVSKLHLYIIHKASVVRGVTTETSEQILQGKWKMQTEERKKKKKSTQAGPFHGILRVSRKECCYTQADPPVLFFLHCASPQRLPGEASITSMDD